MRHSWRRGVPWASRTKLPFGPSQVIMQTVDVGVVTENYPAALDAAARMPTNPGLPLAARCRHLTDRACVHANLGQEEQAWPCC
jgi:hypothetical protein